jgi:fatty-acyl-CoA synthase
VTLTIGAIVDSCRWTAPSGLAATLGTEQCTFARLDRNANQCARVLAAHGVGPGDLVAWWAGTALRTLDGFLACARLGAVFAPFNPGFSVEEAGATLEYLRPAVLVADSDQGESAERLANGLGLSLLVFGGRRPPGRHGPGTDLDAAIESASDGPLGLEVDERGAHILYLTSGSTGRPKGALVSHRASWLRASGGGGTFTGDLRGAGGVLSTFPLYHYGGWSYVLEAWHNRRPVHLVRQAAADHILEAAQRWRASALYAIPAVWERVLTVPEKEYDLSALRHADTGTSLVSSSLLKRIKERIPSSTTSILYGSTEAGRMSRLADHELDERPGSVGRAASPGALRIADDGEVLFRSPGLMLGYLRRPEETAAAVLDGVYHSGDVGRLDDDGYLYLTGRTRELIRSGGETVWPVEVETALRGLPGVTDLAVVGIPDERWGEIVCAALVVPPPGALPDVADVRGHVAARLAPFKQPRRVVAVPSIPRTSATGQVQRRALSEFIQRQSRQHKVADRGRPC